MDKHQTAAELLLALQIRTLALDRRAAEFASEHPTVPYGPDRDALFERWCDQQGFMRFVEFALDEATAIHGAIQRILAEKKGDQA